MNIVIFTILIAISVLAIIFNVIILSLALFRQQSKYKELLDDYAMAVTERNYYLYGLKHGYTLDQVQEIMLKDGE